MGVMEDGLTVLLGFAAAMTVISFFLFGFDNLDDLRSRGLVDNVLLFAFAGPLVFVVLVCFIAFAGGLGLAGWSAFTYLKYGYWPQPNGFAVLRSLGVSDVPYSGWIGFDHIVTWVLSLPATPVILVGSVATVAALVALLMLAFALRR